MPLRFQLRAALARISASLLQAVTIAGVALGDVQPALAAAPEPAPAAAPQQLSDADLDELVAPIALYPDELLAITLPASTFPLQIVQGARFLEKRKSAPDLKPDESWDESVLGLLNYPDVIERMNEELDWTWKLGEAVVAQQPAVMDAIQRFRARVDAAGNLESSDKVVVEKKSEGSQQIIVIQSASPEVIYVPTYQPATVVIHQPVPYAYVYSPPYPYYYNPAAAFWTGMFVGAAIGYGMSWGYGHNHSSVKVNHNYNYKVNVDVNRPGGGNWGGGGNNWKPPADRPSGGRPGRPSGQQPGARPTTRPATAGQARPGSPPRQTAAATRPDRSAARPSGGAQTRPAQSGRDYTRPGPSTGGRGSSLGSYDRGSAARAQGSRGASSRGASTRGGGGGRGGGRGGGGGGGGGRRR